MKKLKVFIILIIIAQLFIFGLILSSQTKKDIIETENNNKEYKSERIAVIVGVNDYLYINDLEYADSDAKKMASILEENGAFTVKLFTTDSENKPLKRDILRELNTVKEDAELGLVKTFVFYFSGHGFKIKKENYLAPMEIDDSNIAGTGIKLSEVLGLVNDIQQNAKVMVFLDACRNNPEGTKSVSVAWEDTEDRGLGILYSTSPGEFSYELKDKKGGIYTNYLVEGLEGFADKAPIGDENGYVSFQEVYKYVRVKMREWSYDNPKGFKQTPRMTALEMTGNFYLTVSGEDISVNTEDTGEIDTTEMNEDNNNYTYRVSLAKQTYSGATAETNYIYNKDNYLIEMDTKRTDGSWANTKYTYNKKGYITKEYTVDSDGKWSEIVYTYDKNDYLINTYTSFSTGEWEELSYEYNDSGNIVTSYGENSDVGSWETSYRYESGYLVEMLTKSIDYEQWTDVSYVYDGRGRISYEYALDSNNYWVKTLYTYDNSTDNLIQVYKTDVYSYWEKTDYTYNNDSYLIEEYMSDSEGNWIKTEFTHEKVYLSRNNTDSE